MMTNELQKETRDKIVAARKAGDKSDQPRSLWIKLYGQQTPTIEDFADVFRSVIAEEQGSAEAQPAAAESEKSAADTKSKSDKKA